MASDIDSERIRSEAKVMLAKIYEEGGRELLAATRTRAMIKKLEKSCGLKDGHINDSEKRSNEVKAILGSEVQRLLEAKADHPPSKKQKKEKKEKKESQKENAVLKQIESDTINAKTASATEKSSQAIVATGTKPEEDDKGQSLRVLSGAEDGQIRFWDIRKGRRATCERVLEGHVGTIAAIEVDWEDLHAASCAEDGAKHWDLRRGVCLRSFTYVSDDATNVGCAAIACNWTSLMIGGCGDGKIRHWDLKTGEIQKDVMAHAGGVWALEVNWPKNKLASGGDEHFKIWDLEDMTCVQTVDGHAGGLMCLSVDWFDNRVLVGSERNLKLWDLEEGTSRNYVGHKDAVACISAQWDAENSIAVSGGWDGQIRQTKVGTETQSATNIFPKIGRIRSIAVDFKSMLAACGSSNGKFHLWDIANAKELQSIEGHIGGITALRIK